MTTHREREEDRKRAQERMKGERLSVPMLEMLRDIQRRREARSPLLDITWFAQPTLKALIKRGLVYVSLSKEVHLTAAGHGTLRDTESLNFTRNRR